MKQIKLLLLAAFIIPGAQAADKTANADVLQSLHAAERIVNSLHPDKPGVARVFAIDGSEYSGGQTLWMKGQLHDAEVAMANGDHQQAALHVQQVANTLKIHGAHLDSSSLLARYSAQY